MEGQRLTDDDLQELAYKSGLSGLQRAGAGGMGVVYHGRDRHDRMIAVKVLPKEHHDADGENARSRFKSEIGHLTRVKHSAVVRFYDDGELDDGRAFFTMDYIEGEDLDYRIRRRRRDRHHFTISETVELLMPIAEALDYLHHGHVMQIIHRDVKPANILIPADPSAERRAVLTDFGISRAVGDSRLTEAGQFIGTEPYSSPEAFDVPDDEEGQSEPDRDATTPASDRYSLAVVAWEMLTLKSLRDEMTPGDWQDPDRPAPMLQGADLHPADRGMSVAVAEVMRKALNAEPSRRFSSAVDFIEALDKAGGRKPVPPVVNAKGRSSATAQQSSTPMIGTLVSLLVVLVLALGGLWWFMRSFPAWQEEERVITATFPKILPTLQNFRGWDGMTCVVGEPANGQRGAIECTDDDRWLRLVDYGSGANRAENLHPENAVGWAYNGCEITSWLTAEDTYALFPTNTAHRFALFFSGQEAAEQRMQLPIC